MARRDHAVHLGDLSLLADMKRVAGDIGAGARDRRPDQQCRRAVQLSPRDGGRSGEELRPQSHVLFRDHQSVAAKAESGRARWCRPHRAPIAARIWILTICRAAAPIRALPSTPSPSSATFSSPANWRSGSRAPASPPIACIPVLSPPASAINPAALFPWACAWPNPSWGFRGKRAPRPLSIWPRRRMWRGQRRIFL